VSRPAPVVLRLSPRWSYWLYAGLTLLCLVVHNRLVDSAATDARRSLHEQVLANAGPAPLQYRVMTFYLAEGLDRAASALGVSDGFRLAYLALRGAFTFLSAVLLHRFLALYLPLPFVVLGVVLAFAWMPLTYVNYYMQETDPANFAFFLLGYLLIRRRDDRGLAVLLPVAMLNRETPVLLPLVWLLYRWDELPVGALLARFAGLCALAFGAYFGLRFGLGHHTAYAEFNDLALNLRSFNSYYYFVLLFGAVSVPAFRNLAGKPKFLRRLAAFLPFFLVFHFVIPIFQETRLFLPVFPVFLALALTSFVEPRPEAYAEEERPAVSPLAPRGRALFWAAFAAFVLAMAAYLSYLERAHVDDLRVKKKSELHSKLAYEAFSRRENQVAAREWEWALEYDPSDYEAHFNLAALYAEALFDLERAERHLEACRRLSPTDPNLPDLERRLANVRARWQREAAGSKAAASGGARAP
jgi:hypothetical protein